jgi:hypothetical protein
MAIDRDVRSGAEHVAILRRLVGEQDGIGRFGLFFLNDEGRLTPDGYRESSGNVINGDGRVFAFWLGWDEAQGRVRLTVWRPVDAQSHWQTDPEYLRAQHDAGLNDQPPLGCLDSQQDRNGSV